jgi:hypothetical protein
LQLPFGPDEDDVVLPSDDAELEALLLSAWAAAATARARAPAQKTVAFMGKLLAFKKTRPMQRRRAHLHRACVMRQSRSLIALMLAGVVATVLAVLAGVLIGVVEAGAASRRAAGADRRSCRALSG